MGVQLSSIEYRLLVEHSPVMIWRAGLNAECDYFNETWLAFTGRTLEEECGNGWAEGVHAEDLDRCVKYYLDHFQRREAFEMEYRLRRHDGVYRWIFDRGTPFHDERGEFAGFIGSCVDVDDRRRTQEARERRDEEQLAYARDFERWLLAIVSHDIRNPLGAIRLSGQMLARGHNAPVAAGERIVRSVDRIDRIVGDLLDVSRERHGAGIPIKPAEADLRAICEQVIDELQTANRKLTIECEGDARGPWDPHRLTQAISNIVGNAVQHGIDGEVRVVLRSTPDRVVAEVHNRGAIPKAVLPTIFDPFRSGTEGAQSSGLGLGLFIARAIVRAHRGGIEVDSTEEQGTTFRLTLPRA